MLEDVKMLLGIPASDTDSDEKLRLILASVSARLKILLGGIDPPESLRHIVTDVAVIRYNRIGSEGMTAHTVEGESYSFAEDDFSGYMDEIRAFLESKEEATRGKVRFL